MVTSETRRSLQRTAGKQGNSAQGQKGQIGMLERRAPQQAHQSQGRHGGMGGEGLGVEGFFCRRICLGDSRALQTFFVGGGGGVWTPKPTLQ